MSVPILTCVSPRTEKQLPPPRIPSAPSNPNYGVNLDGVDVIFEQWPGNIVSVNAEVLPYPPPPPDSHSAVPPSLITPWHRRPPLSLAISQPWLPFRRAGMEQLVKANRDRIFHGRKTDGVCFGPAELRGFTAVGSELLKARDSILPFLSSMQNANMFRIAGRNMIDEAPDFLFKEAEALT